MLSYRQKITPREDKHMSIEKQAQDLGFQIIGNLRRCEEQEQSWRYLCYSDEANNEYVLYRGILTIITPEGKII
jgi:hypothetical protein